MYTLEIKEEANIEIIDAYSYYENQQSGLGETFFEQLGLYFKRITENQNILKSKIITEKLISRSFLI